MKLVKQKVLQIEEFQTCAGNSQISRKQNDEYREDPRFIRQDLLDCGNLKDQIQNKQQYPDQVLNKMIQANRFDNNRFSLKFMSKYNGVCSIVLDQIDKRKSTSYRQRIEKLKNQLNRLQSISDKRNQNIRQKQSSNKNIQKQQNKKIDAEKNILKQRLQNQNKKVQNKPEKIDLIQSSTDYDIQQTPLIQKSQNLKIKSKDHKSGLLFFIKNLGIKLFG